jgi:hypothetical protein
MANSEQIRQLLEMTGKKMSDSQVSIISERTAKITEFDQAKVAAELCNFTKPTAYDISDLINKNTIQKEGCGLCGQGWIPILNTPAWLASKCPDYAYDVCIPKAQIPCPNCNTTGAAQRILDGLLDSDTIRAKHSLKEPGIAEDVFNIRRDTVNELERQKSNAQGYSYAILYGFILEHHVSPAEFSITQYYPSLNFAPPLTQSHRNLMDWINKPHNVDVPKPPKPAVHNPAFSEPADAIYRKKLTNIGDNNANTD